MGEPIDPIGICPVDPGLAKQGIRILAWEIGERETPEQRTHGTRPIRHRRLATGEDRPHVLAEARDEGCPKPRVEWPQDLVSVENEEDTIAKFGEAGRGVGRGQQVAADDARHGGKKSPLGRLDLAAIEANDGRAPGPCLARVEARPARSCHAGNTVDEGDERGWAIQHFKQDGPLPITTDESRGLLFDTLPDREAHPAILGTPSITSGGGEPRVVAHDPRFTCP